MEKNLLKKVNRTSINLVEGNITQISSDAIMTAINSGGLWFGGIDRAIQGVAGNLYHTQAVDKMPLKDLQVIVAKGNRDQHRGLFDNVIFVVDDLESSLQKVIYNGLEAATQENYKTILIPSIRLGVMAGVVEKTPQEAIERMGTGINQFLNKYGKKTSLKDITFVVYDGNPLYGLLQKGLNESSMDSKH